MISFLRQRWKFLLLLVVLGTAGVVGFKPVMGKLRQWRAERLLAEAQVFAGEENWAEMRRTAMASAQLAPSLEAARLFHRAQRRMRDPEVLRAAVALFLAPGATGEDRAEALATFLDTGDLIGFARLLPAVPPEQREGTELRFQLTRFLLARGHSEDALKIAEAVPAEERGARFDLLLAQGLIRDRRPEVRALALGRLGRLLENGERESALNAFRILASQPDAGIDAGLAKKALERFGDDETLGVSERLALRMFRMGQDPEERASLVSGAIEAYRETHFEKLLEWLLRVGEEEQVVALTEAIERSPEVFERRGTALRVLGRYDELARELENPPPGMPPAKASATAAAVAHLRGRTAEEATLWKRALSFAELRPAENGFYEISRIAAEVGAVDEQMEALASALEHRVGIPPLADQLTPLFVWLAKRDTARLLSVSRRLLEREPGNPVLVNNYHYLVTLHRGPEAHTVETLGKLVEAFPEEVPFRGSLALAQLKSDDPEGALQTLKAVEGAPTSLPEGEKAVYAAALGALDRQPEAEELRKTIDWNALDEGEAKIFRGMMR